MISSGPSFEAFVGRAERPDRLHRTHQRDGAYELEAHFAAGHEIDPQEAEAGVSNLNAAEARHRQLEVAQGVVVRGVLAVANGAHRLRDRLAEAQPEMRT